VAEVDGFLAVDGGIIHEGVVIVFAGRIVGPGAIVVNKILQMVPNFVSVPISEDQLVGHFLFAADMINAIDNVLRHRKFSPSSTFDPLAGYKAKEIVTAVCIPGGSQTNSSGCTRLHTSGMFLMCLHVLPKLAPGMQVKS
jgi:hypothetical protein